MLSLNGFFLLSSFRKGDKEVVPLPGHEGERFTEMWLGRIGQGCLRGHLEFGAKGQVLLSGAYLC